VFVEKELPADRTRKIYTKNRKFEYKADALR